MPKKQMDTGNRITVHHTLMGIDGITTDDEDDEKLDNNELLSAVTAPAGL